VTSYSFVDQSLDLKRKNISLLDQVFPEYETEKLTTLLNHVSKGRLDESRAYDKASRLKEDASNTFGISIGTDVFKLQIQLLLDQISLIEQHFNHWCYWCNRLCYFRRDWIR